MNAAAVALAYKQCERITRSRARNFYYGIRLLPPRQRSAMCALYAMARRIDDIGDGPGAAGAADNRLHALQEVRTSLELLAKATGGKHTNGVRKAKKTELSQLARHATESFIDAQRKLVDVAGRQMNANVKTAGKTLELLRPFPFLPLAELTREGVKSYVDAQKELMEVMVKPNGEHKPAHKVAHRAKRSPKKHAAVTAA